VSIVSHTLWYGLIHRHPINVTAPFALLTPVFAVLFGVLILGEQFTVWMLAGGLITLAGVTIIMIRRPAQAEPSPERRICARSSPALRPTSMRGGGERRSTFWPSTTRACRPPRAPSRGSATRPPR